MGLISSRTEQSTFHETIHYSQVINQHSDDQLIYQSPIVKLSTRYLHKITLPYITSNDTLSSYLDKLQFYGNRLDSENLYLPVRCEVSSLGGICQEEKKIHVYYQIYDFSLRSEIIARQKLKEMFSEEEVWYVLFSVLNGLRQFQRYKLGSGNLKTSFIRMNEAGHVKIVNMLSIMQDHDQLTNLKAYYDQKLLEVEKSKIVGGQKKYISSISQTFALGIIILELCTFIEGSSFYNIHNFSFNEPTFHRAFQLSRKLYSPLLNNLIEVMLSKYEDRPLPSQIYDVFYPFKKQILTLQKFTFDISHLEKSLYQSRVKSRY